MALPEVARAGPESTNEAEARWSFRPLGSPSPPMTRDRRWIETPIDAFVLRKLEDHGLRPASAASRLTLLRRLSFDLLGLPPTPDEVARFLGDQEPDAYERLVDRLLASPRYGERWGRHWLDVVRYADTGGFETDLLYPRAWRFRDYVIRSLNADKPFDRFAREQVAGDELWPDEPDAVLGSTLYSVGPALVDSAMVTGQLEYEWLTDAADTTGEVFLGLTFGCARCHDHKYDPIRQRDYFAMQAIFAASDRSYPDQVRLNRIKALNGLLSEVPVPKEFLDDPRCTVKDEDRQGFRLFHRAEPLVIHRLHRGELNKPQEVVEPGLPAAVSTASDRAELARTSPTNRRAALARWLTSPGNPLVARVLVNRVWGWHFGRGIVRHAQRFRRPGRGADPPRAARLPGQRPDRTRLEPQASAPADRALQHLPDGERADRCRGPRRPREPPALAIPSPTPGGRRDPRRDARVLGPAQLQGVREARRPAAGQGRADGPVRRSREVARHPGRFRARPSQRLPAREADLHLSDVLLVRPSRADDQLRHDACRRSCRRRR